MSALPFLSDDARSAILRLATCAEFGVRADSKCVAEWLATDAKDAREHDPDVGIFGNEDMGNVFDTLGSLIEAVSPMGTTIARELRALAAPMKAATASPYGIVDPDYARVFTMARCIAWQEGYALMMHGSFTRDLDLLAVPWGEQVCDAENLVRRIADAADLKIATEQPGQKPHGRLAWTLMFKGFSDPRFIDLSVFPSPPPAMVRQPVQQQQGRAGEDEPMSSSDAVRMWELDGMSLAERAVTLQQYDDAVSIIRDLVQTTGDEAADLRVWGEACLRANKLLAEYDTPTPSASLTKGGV